jgi:hypothetical protein
MVLPIEDSNLRWRGNEDFSERLKSFGIGEIRDWTDPYLLWMINGGSVGDEEGRFPLLIQLRSKEAAKVLVDAYGPQTHEQVVLLADWWCNEIEHNQYLSVHVRRKFFALLGNPESPLASLVDRIEFGRTLFDSRVGARLTRDSSAPLEGRQAIASGTQRGHAECANHSSPPPALERSGPPVVVGIVDDGIAFAHSHFLSGDGVTTRMHAFWDQRDPDPSAGAADPAATSVPYGNELRRDDINRLLDKHRHAGLVDEDALYAEVGQRQVRQRVRHGTHVLDVAAGSGPGALPDAVIVAVQLPATIAADASGANLAPYLLDAVRYIVARADALATAPNSEDSGSRAQLPPVVINLSYGLMGGPHDGSSLLELALADLVARREGPISLALQPPGKTAGACLAADKAPLAIVIAAGNSTLERCHAQFDLPAAGTQQLRWRIPPDCRTPSYLEIWIPQGADVKVTVQPPAPFSNRKGSVTSSTGPVHLLRPGQGDPSLRLLASLSYVPGAASSAASGGVQPGSYGLKDMVLVAVAPTEGLDLDRAWAPPGVWTIEVINTDSSNPAQQVHAWIRRNDSPFGWRTGGRQSRFEDADYQIFDDQGRLVEEDPSPPPSYIRRETTFNGIATGENVFVVGALRADTKEPTPYSAHGPALPVPGGARPGPAVSAPADRSAARPGVSGAGTRSGGSAVFLNGTSVAAPAVVRRLVDQFSINPRLSSGEAYRNIIGTTQTLGNPARSCYVLKDPVSMTLDDPT